MRMAQHALVLGDGDGRFTAALLEANATVTVDAVDASGAMLKALLKRAGQHAKRVQIHQMDMRTWKPGTVRYDLIASHFFLDCFTTDEVEDLAGQVAIATCPGALWAISDFHVPAGVYGQIIARPLVAALYRAFGLLTGLGVRSLPHHGLALARSGFALGARRCFLGGLLVAEGWRAHGLSPQQIP